MSRLQAYVFKQFPRIWALLKSRSVVTQSTQQRATTDAKTQPQVPSHKHTPAKAAGTSAHAAGKTPTNEQKEASSRRERRKSFLRCRDVVCMIYLFLWAILWTIIVITWAIACSFIPDKFRRMRDIGKEVVLVTNAGRGLGRRLAIFFSLKAALVVCWDPDSDRHMNTVYDIRHRGGRAVGFTVDVTDETAVTTAAELMKRQVGTPDMLVMNAGRRSQRPLLQWHPEDLEKMYHVNVTPHLMLLRTFLPTMLARNNGHLVCVISASTSVPLAYDAPYAATKVGLAALMRGLADELEILPGNKIRITCVYPCHTEMRPPLANMAKVVVDQVLRGKRSVIVPRRTLFWLGFLQTLPATARRRWRRFYARLYEVKRSKIRIEGPCPWIERWPLDRSVAHESPSPSPYEMPSVTSFDNMPPGVIKRRNQPIEVPDE